MAKRRTEINREQEKERIRNYQRNRYKRNRNEAVAKLGGKCVVCETTGQLEFDHIDPATKESKLRKNSGSLFH